MDQPDNPDRRSDLHKIADHAADYLESLPGRHVGGTTTAPGMERPFPETGTPADVVIDELVRDIDDGLVASAGPRHFGFVIGGATHGSLMADWLTSAWDQNAQVYLTSPAAAAAETIAARWLLELLGLPTDASVGFVTGCQMANFTALGCGRDAVLRVSGWEVERQGLFGAPQVTVLMSECGHATVRSSLSMLGFGEGQICEIASDQEGRIDLEVLRTEIESRSGTPLIVSLQAGNVNTGAFESVGDVADILKEQNAWIHLDGAFGLWAAASPKLATRLDGVDRADSWATDAHKWLNVPYDSGIVVIKDPAQHRRFKSARCAYTGEESDQRRDGSSWVPENSRRARGLVLYAAIRELGRSGIREIVERCCGLAQRVASEVEKLPSGQVLNDVVLNQVLVRFSPPEVDDLDAFHAEVAERIQSDGKCWVGTTEWKGQTVLRVSVCNWQTTEEDIDVLIGVMKDQL